jgi:hypothetical protein
MNHKLLPVVVFFCGICGLLSAQDEFDFSYGIDKIYPSVSTTADKLKDINSLTELNRYYKSSWVKDFISVDISAYHDGEAKVVTNINDELTEEQKELILDSDLNSDISVVVHYIPDNTLSDNEPQKFNFTFKLEPDSDASFPGGQQKLIEYIENKAISQLDKDDFRANHLTAIEFSVDETGKVVDAEIYDMDAYGAEQYEKANQVLLDAICKMPDWDPAAYASGDQVKQDFVLRVGDMNSCISNFFNIRGDQRPALDSTE